MHTERATRFLLSMLVALSFLIPALGLGVQVRPVHALPAEFEDTLVAEIDAPMDLAWTGDGRILIPVKGGELWVIENSVLQPTPAIDLSGVMCTNGERALGGVAVHPDYASNHYIYLYYTYNKFGTCDESETDGPVNRLSRFELEHDNTIDPASETVLFDTPPLPKDHHNGGDIAFGSDGYLYVTVGDGGSRTFENPQGVSYPQDPGRLLGKIVRLTDTGAIPPDNPHTGADSARCNVDGVPPSGSPAGTKCQEVYSVGLRNPFRFAFDPNSPSVRYYINDVGQHSWEEISEGPLPGGNYGWPIMEGPCLLDSTTECDPDPSFTDPVHWYVHGPDGGAATGGAFVPNGIWPATYDGTYLYADYVFGKIYQLVPGGAGCRTCSPPTSDFIQTEFTTAENVVAMEFGPHGNTQALYYVTRGFGPTDIDGLRRIAFVGDVNRSPTALATADPTSGHRDPASGVLSVQFDGTSSSDPDDNPLSYEWDFEGDGSADSTDPTPVYDYAVDGTFFATLMVDDNLGGTDTTTIRIDVGNTPPVPEILTPGAGATFAVGDIFTLTGSAIDPEDGALGDTSLTWEVRQHHAEHYHPFLDLTVGNNIQIPPAPEPEDFLAATNSFLEVLLTATDPSGLSATVSRNIMPRTVKLDFDTVPSGLDLELDGFTVSGPVTAVTWENHGLQLNAPDQTDSGGVSWAWESWSDAGSQSHIIVVPATAPGTPYVATFTEVPLSGQTFNISRDGTTSTYHADSPGLSFTGSLKFVVESAVEELKTAGAGNVIFGAGDFDLGSDWFEINDATNVLFAGQGIDVTFIRNNSSAATDTEPFDMTRSDYITIRDMTISASGSLRNTSDAIDFDGGDFSVIDRVKITSSRGRGIIFDGKDDPAVTGGTADGNVVRNCVITGVPEDGIQLLASNNNTIENCTITDVGGDGIRINKASPSAGQPNKPSDDNIVTGNYIENAGENGIRVNGSNRNLISGNTVLNSSDDVSGRDGINIRSSDSNSCNDNVVQLNSATDNQPVKTQEWGLNIEDPECVATVVSDNVLIGNLAGEINDDGTGTIYTSADTEPPTPPTGLTATSVTEAVVGLMWNASTDNVAVNAYDIYRDGSMIDSVDGTTTTYQDTTFTLGVTHQYYVIARDPAANPSAPSNTLDVMTPEPPPILTFTPTDDAYIKESRPTRNYDEITVKVDGSSKKDGLFRFNVSGVAGSSITSATLRLWVTNGSSTGGAVLDIDPNWSETTVTWGTAPVSADPPIGALGAVENGSWVELDLTGQILGDGAVAYRITSGDPNGAAYASKEHVSGNAAELIIVLGDPAPPDTEPPSAPGNLVATDVQFNSVTLDWDASIDNVGVVAYDIYRDAVQIDTVSASTTTYQDSSVAAGETYDYLVEARDAAGNTASSAVEVTTPDPPPPDTEPPSAPGNLLATDVQFDSVTLDWDASTDNVGVVAYDIYRDAVQIDIVSASTTSYQDLTVAPTTTYQYEVRARDLAGNVAGSLLGVTTPAGPSILTFNPTDDAYVKESSPTRNYNRADIAVDASSKKDGLLRFEVSGIGNGTVASAVLRLYVTDSSPYGGDFFKMNDVNWSENTVTWETAPAGDGGLVGSLGAVEVGFWVEVDVTGLVTVDGIVSLRITSPNSNGADYGSKEHVSGFAPELIIALS